MPLQFGVEVTIPRLNPLLGALIVGDLLKVSAEWAKDVLDEAQFYPPKRPGQRYQRTFKLRRGWVIQAPRLEGGDIVTAVVNDVGYGPKVFGDNAGSGQARVHQNRWRKLLQVGSSVVPLERRAQGALDRRIAQAFTTATIKVV